MSLLFNAGTQKVVMPTIAEVDTPTDFTVMAWLYLDSLAKDGVIASTWDNNGDNKGWLFMFDKSNGGGNQRISLLIGNNSVDRVLSANAEVTGEWHHWAALKDTSVDELRLYKDGVFDSKTTGDTLIPQASPNDVHFGKDAPGDSGTRPLSGRLAHSCFNDVVLTLGEINSAMRRGYALRGLVYHCPLYTDAADYSGNAYNGIITGATSADHAPVGPIFGFDLGWQGTVTSLETPVSKSIQTEIAFTRTIQPNTQTYYEASQGLANSKQSEIESNVLSIVPVSTSVESIETLAKISRTETEYAAHILESVGVSIESLLPASSTISTSFESLVSQAAVSKSIQTQMSFAGTVQLIGETDYETTQLVASLRTTPHEFLTALKMLISAPAEHLRGIQAIKQSEVESNALSSASASTSLEHTETSERSAQTQTEHLNHAVQSAEGSIENLLSASNAISTTIESLGSQTAVSKAIQTDLSFAQIVQVSKETAIEISETLISSRPTLKESLASLSKQVASLTEHLQTVQGIRLTGFEYSGTGTFVSKSISTEVAFIGLISVQASVEIEMTEGILTPRAVALELLQGARSLRQAQTERLGGIQSQRPVKIESRGVVRSSRSTQIEHWQRLEQRIQTEYETLKSVSRLTGVSVENLLSVPKQVETSFESIGSGLVLQVVIEDAAQFVMAIEETAGFAMEIEDIAQF